MQAAKQIRLSRNARRCSRVSRASSSNTESIQRKQKSALCWIDGIVSIAAKACVPLGVVGDVGVEQGQVELDVDGLLEQLARQVQPAPRGC